MDSFKSGFVAIVGRPNAGKSTLMNKLIGSKVAIVSPKPQTTRNKIVGILTENNYQIVFLDTPGIFKPQNVLGDFMMKNVDSAVKDVDVVLVLIDSSVGVRDKDIEIIKKYNKKGGNLFVILTKIDIANKENVGKQIEMLSHIENIKEIVPISTRKNINITLLKDLLVSTLEMGVKYYNDDMITDKTERFMVGEIVREKALLVYQDEIPHGISVCVNSMKIDEEANRADIDVDIICERESHKSIIIGKGGLAVKKVASLARVDIEKLLDAKVFLTVWVRIKENWRDKNNMLREIGYDNKDI